MPKDRAANAKVAADERRKAVSIYPPDEIRELIEQIAIAEDRTVGNAIIFYLKRGLIAAGKLPA